VTLSPVYTTLTIDIELGISLICIHYYPYNPISTVSLLAN
jgi:hypothetical protein